ncbi:hypothetical protein V1523DRAFT_419068 [Lipomyces doorenjongii]
MWGNVTSLVLCTTSLAANSAIFFPSFLNFSISFTRLALLTIICSRIRSIVANTGIDRASKIQLLNLPATLELR